MTRKLRDLEARIVRVFVEKLQLESPTPELDLFETGTLDSLRLVRLLAELEGAFGIRLSMEELEFEDFRTLAGIARFVAARLPDYPSRMTTDS
jgi:acyl carrier protein